MSDHFETPICPNCGHIIEEDDTIDEYYSDVDSIDFIVYGTCPNCGKNYHWIDHYKHAYNCNLEEE